MKRLREYSGLILLFCICAFLLYYLSSKTFDISKFNANNEMKTIVELTDNKYEGRLAGTKGNQLALDYVQNYFKEIGVEAGGDNGTYYQNFKSMVPMHMSKPYLKIIDKSGKIVREYSIGTEYREILDDYGGSGNVDTQLYYLKSWGGDYNASQLNGKVIVVNTLPGNNEIKFAIDSGVKGILCPAEVNLAKTPVNTENKMGISIMINTIREDLFAQIQQYAKDNMRISMKLDEQFKYVDTPNVIGKIEGSDKNAGYLMFSANIDGFGREFDGKTYYPGAVESAAGTSIVMEIAKVFKSQKHKPEKTIIFALWNNENYGKKGKQYYLKNPIYPLTDSSIIYVHNTGSKIAYQQRIDYSGQASQIFRDKMAQFSSFVVMLNDPTQTEEFAKGGATAISMGDNLYNVNDWGSTMAYRAIGTPADKIDAISVDKMSMITNSLLTFVKKEIAGDIFGGLFNNTEKMLFVVLFLSWLLVYVVSTINRLKPNLKLGKLSMEDIYYSTPYEVFDKLVRYLSQAGIVIILLVFLTHIPANLNLFTINGVIHTNFSWNQVTADTVNYFRSLYNNGFGVTNTGIEVWDFISYSFSRSFWLLMAALVVGLIIGIAKGIFDSFRDDDKSNMRTVGTILVFSLPDVFVVIMIQMLLIFLYSHNIVKIPREYMEPKLFVEALLCLVVLPAIYITRIASVAVHEEKKKGYIKAAKAKGLSNIEIIQEHLLISVLIKVTEALPSLLSLMISNLIIVEYLSSYKGIVTNMMLAFRQGDINMYTGLAISLCTLYVTFVVIFRLSGKLLNPLKRREI